MSVPDPHHLALADADLASAFWLKLRAHLQARLELLRNYIEQDIDPIKTAHTRGQIAELKKLLAAGDSQD